MFTSFTGNTRRPRQVNLGGRKTHAFGSTSGSQAAVDRAQQDRAQRQRERETLKAASKIQRVWRGHRSRRQVGDLLRQKWDAVEGPYTSSPTATSYSSEGEALSQLQRLLRFANIRDEDDIKRIRHFHQRQTKMVHDLNLVGTGAWPSSYLKLQRIVLRILERQTKELKSLLLRGESLQILRFLAEQIPAETSKNAPEYYRILAYVFSGLFPNRATPDAAAKVETLDLLFAAVIAPLTTVTGYTLNAYEAFGFEFLTLPDFDSDAPSLATKYRDSLANTVNYKLLASALATSLKDHGLQSREELASIEGRIRFLGLFIYFHRYAHNFQSSQAYAGHKDFVTVVSMFLNSLPNDVVEGPASDGEIRTREEHTVNQFLKDQILSLVNQDGIGNLLAESTQSTDSTEDEKIEEARQLANYALALLRFFPRRGDEIRMWLYMGPSNSQSGKAPRKYPAIKYFWEASKRSSVFSTIMRDSRAAIDLLRPKTAQTNGFTSDQSLTQHSFWQAPRQEVDLAAVRADEWRVILVFLELYTFVLKVTDDEEFFSGGKDGVSNQVRDNALPLTEVKDLTTFLKNLGFTLYFNASDINEPDERETTSSISFFNPQATEAQQQKQAVEHSVGGVAGLSLDYVKGLVTGLVRMVYERDSRRKFLPGDHWLMTSRFDMQGFIPAVVEEEESRHRIQEEDAEDMDDEEEDFDDTPQLIGTSRTQQQRRLERLQRQQRKASRRRYLQSVAPRLEILQNMPFFIPFTTRVQIFREFVTLDMTKRRGSSDPESWRLRVMQRPDAPHQFDKHAARVRRGAEFEDAFSQFYELGEGLKEPIQITFVDQFDQPEAGIDGGGVTKEFLTSVTSTAFAPNTDGIDMFVENDQHLLYPNPTAVEELKEILRQGGLREGSAEFRQSVNEFLQRYEFLGRIIGKCMYEGILVDVSFAPFFLRKWALTGGTGSAPNETGYRPTLNDLRDLDEELYQGLHKLKTYDGNVEDFGLNFTITDTIPTSRNPQKTNPLTKDLRPSGASISVTNQNRLVYISYVARHRLQSQPYLQTSAFLRGLATMIQPSWLSMFNAPELTTLIGGTPSPLDVDDLRRNTLYGGTYALGDDGLEHPTIALFWKIMHALSDGERRAVLKFVTSTPRAPLLGFRTLNPRFSIRDAGAEQERLPSTSTCVNLLKLPMYRSEEVMREKLLYSVFSGAGFDLS